SSWLYTLSLHDALPIFADGRERLLEHLRPLALVAEHPGEPRELGAQLPVGRIGLHRARHGRERERRIVETVLLQVGDPRQQADQDARIARVLELHLERADELRPVPTVRVDRLE